MESFSASGSGSGSSPGQVLLEIFPKPILWGIGLAALVLAVGGCLLGIFWRNLAAYPISQYFLLVLVAFCAGIGLFLLFPDRIEFANVKIGPAVTKLVGPLAIAAIVYYPLQTRLEKLRQELPHGRLFFVANSQDVAHHLTTIQDEDDPEFQYYKVLWGNKTQASVSDTLVGVYVIFPPGKTEYDVTVSRSGLTREVKLARSGSDRFELPGSPLPVAEGVSPTGEGDKP